MTITKNGNYVYVPSAHVFVSKVFIPLHVWIAGNAPLSGAKGNSSCRVCGTDVPSDEPEQDVVCKGCNAGIAFIKGAPNE